MVIIEKKIDRSCESNITKKFDAIFEKIKNNVQVDELLNI